MTDHGDGEVSGGMGRPGAEMEMEVGDEGAGAVTQQVWHL
jgi:hypothetical protein